MKNKAAIYVMLVDHVGVLINQSGPVWMVFVNKILSIGIYIRYDIWYPVV